MKRLLARTGIAGVIVAAVIGLAPGTASAAGWYDDSWWTDQGPCDVRGTYYVNDGQWYAYDCSYHSDHGIRPWLLRGFYD